MLKILSCPTETGVSVCASSSSTDACRQQTTSGHQPGCNVPDHLPTETRVTCFLDHLLMRHSYFEVTGYLDAYTFLRDWLLKRCLYSQVTGYKEEFSFPGDQSLRAICSKIDQLFRKCLHS